MASPSRKLANTFQVIGPGKRRGPFRFTGKAYLRPLGRGITIENPTDVGEPYLSLDEEIERALVTGEGSGRFHLEILARKLRRGE